MADSVKIQYYRVNTPYRGSFSIPHSCVMCGDPPGPGLDWKLSGSKSDWTGKRSTTLTLKVPLCQECFTVNKDKKIAGFLVGLGALVAIGLCFILPTALNSLSSSIFKGSALNIVISLAIFIIFCLLVRWLGDEINQKGFTPDQRERRKRVKRCAKIMAFTAPSRSNINGWILFRFENPTFASMFAAGNGGQLIPPKN
jgi:hypothetical protein